MLSTNPINEDAPSNCSSTAKRTLIERCIQVSKGREMEDERYSSGAFSGTDSYAPCRHGTPRKDRMLNACLQVPAYLSSSKNVWIHDHVDKSHGRDLPVSRIRALYLVTPTLALMLCTGTSQSVTGSQIAPQVLRSRSRWSILFEPYSYTKEFNCQAAYSNFKKRWTS